MYLYVYMYIRTVTNFDKGHANITAWVDYIPDPIFQEVLSASCSLLSPVLPVKCPIQKGRKYKAI